MRMKIGAWGSRPLLPSSISVSLESGNRCGPTSSTFVQAESANANANSIGKTRVAFAPEMIKLIRSCPRRVAITNDSQTLIWGKREHNPAAAEPALAPLMPTFGPAPRSLKPTPDMQEFLLALFAD